MSKEEMKEELQKMLDEATKSITADKEYWKGLAGKWRLEAQARKEKIDELESRTDSILDAVIKNKYSFLIFMGWSFFCFGFGFFVNSVLSSS